MALSYTWGAMTVVGELFPRLRGKWIDAKRRDVGGEVRAPPLRLARQRCALTPGFAVLPPFHGGRVATVCVTLGPGFRRDERDDELALSGVTNRCGQGGFT